VISRFKFVARQHFPSYHVLANIVGTAIALM
jgi:hypothetical protein